MTPKTCPKCAQPMVEGYLSDRIRGAIAEWIEGVPVYSPWLGHIRWGRVRRKVATYCCAKCGFLESYAKPEGT